MGGGRWGGVAGCPAGYTTVGLGRLDLLDQTATQNMDVNDFQLRGPPLSAPREPPHTRAQACPAATARAAEHSALRMPRCLQACCTQTAPAPLLSRPLSLVTWPCCPQV